MEAMEVDGAVDEYGDWHRQFVQALLSRPALSPDELKKLADSVCGQHAVSDVAQLKTFLSTVRKKVQPLGLDLKKARSERDGSPLYALINTQGGEETAACAGFSELQLRFLRAVIREVVTAESGEIPEMTAINLAEGMSLTEAERLLKRLVRDCWLEEVDGQVALHARCLLELEPYLVQHYAEYAPRCPLCSEIVVHGQRCEHAGCRAKYHLHCLKKLRGALKVAKCHECHSVMPSEGQER